ncbi:hypothetical protein D915_009111 [Fasciola hepatica]|uniref:Tc1-like transposase DDE domain-containing protein n=1 Tax=Fasciola hepatica TaxID=6192 RepID=A0A4E0RTF6_FASHE|nr:hypothetical protein D915_009111 [Fasciola hepatica]
MVNVNIFTIVIRGRYSRTDEEVHKRVIQAPEGGYQWSIVAKPNGVNYKTEYNWVRANKLRWESQPRGGTRRMTLNDTEIEEMMTWVEEDPTKTIDLLRIQVKAEFKKEVSCTTIGSYLDCRLITPKKLHLISFGMNRLDTKEGRTYYALQMFEVEQRGDCICWTDETNFNLLCTRTVGWSTKGKRSCLQVSNSRRRNFHLIGAVTKSGIVSCKIKRGVYRSEDCKQWIW